MCKERKFHKLIEAQDPEEKARVWRRIQAMMQERDKQKAEGKKTIRKNCNLSLVRGSGVWQEAVRVCERLLAHSLLIFTFPQSTSE